jgi:invasion protein IalB
MDSSDKLDAWRTDMKRSDCTGSCLPLARLRAIAVAGTTLFGALAADAFGQQAAPQPAPSSPGPRSGVPEVPQRGAREPLRAITYGDWRKYCFKAAGTKTLCRTTITGTFDTGQIAVRVDLIERDGGGDGTRVQLFLPVGMYLQAGVKLTIDQGRPFQIPYSWCLTNACIAADLADPKLINEMESGQNLILEVVDSNILSVSSSISLAQFASVRHGAPVQTFDQAIDE